MTSRRSGRPLGRPFSPVPPQNRVMRAQLQPAGLGEDLGGGLAMVGQEGIEPFDVGDEVVHPQRRQGFAAARSVAGGQRAHMVQVVEHEDSDGGGVVAEPGRQRGVLCGDPIAEDLQPGPADEDGAPGQPPGLQRDLEVPLGGFSEPEWVKLLKVEAVAAQGLVFAQRDPLVEPGVPGLAAPPGPLVVGGPEHLVASAQQGGGLSPPVSRGQTSLAACPGRGKRPLPFSGRSRHQRCPQFRIVFDRCGQPWDQ